MHQSRYDVACTVFDGNVLVSGGYIDERDHFASTNTVEVYDHVADTWSYMPNMVERRLNHKLVAIKCKLYVVGDPRIRYEVFDKLTNKFVFMKSSPLLFNTKAAAVSIGNKIAVFGRRSYTVVFYDTENDEWYDEPCETIKDLWIDFCIKIPQT